MDYKHGGLYVYDATSQTFDLAEPIKIDATEAQLLAEDGDPIDRLDNALIEVIDKMSAKDGPQESFIVLQINNDLEIEDEESEDESTDESGLEKET